MLPRSPAELPDLACGCVPVRVEKAESYCSSKRFSSHEWSHHPSKPSCRKRNSYLLDLFLPVGIALRQTSLSLACLHPCP